VIDTEDASSNRARKRKEFLPFERSKKKNYMKMSFKIIKWIIINGFVYYCLCLVISWNFATHGYANLAPTAAGYAIIWTLHLDQSWAMFSPRPPDVHWWYNIEGRLANGTKVELWDHGAVFTHVPNPFSWEKPNPKNFVVSFKNHRWFKYYENGYNTHSENQEIRLEYGRWVCREYNKVNFNQKHLVGFSVHWMNERLDTNLMDGTRIPGSKHTLWNHQC